MTKIKEEIAAQFSPQPKPSYEPEGDNPIEPGFRPSPPEPEPKDPSQPLWPKKEEPMPEDPKST